MDLKVESGSSEIVLGNVIITVTSISKIFTLLFLIRSFIKKQVKYSILFLKIRMVFCTY